MVGFKLLVYDIAIECVSKKKYRPKRVVRKESHRWDHLKNSAIDMLLKFLPY